MIKEQLDKSKLIEEEKLRLFGELEKHKKEYAYKVGNLHDMYSKVVDAGSYSFEEAIKVICYLVSLVEGKQYTYREKELPIVYGAAYESGWIYVDLNSYNHPMFGNKYRLQYICADEEAAENELDSKINGLHAMGMKIYSEKPLKPMKEILTTPAVNYVQIAIFSNGDPFWTREGKIEFEDNNDFFKKTPITLINWKSKICDPAFMYIVDFMNYLTARKLEKADITLTLEEMLEYARIYAEEVRKQRDEKGKELTKGLKV